MYYGRPEAARPAGPAPWAAVLQVGRCTRHGERNQCVQHQRAAGFFHGRCLSRGKGRGEVTLTPPAKRPSHHQHTIANLPRLLCKYITIRHAHGQLPPRTHICTVCSTMCSMSLFETPAGGCLLGVLGRRHPTPAAHATMQVPAVLPQPVYSTLAAANGWDTVRRTIVCGSVGGRAKVALRYDESSRCQAAGYVSVPS